MTAEGEQIIKRLHSLANPANVEGMKRYGINPAGTLGVNMPTLRSMAKEAGKNHPLALELWVSGIHEARILASMIDDPSLVSEDQAERWVQDFDSWDVCDQVSSNLFERMPFSREKAFEWSQRPEEFVKRAGFVIMAGQAVHRKKVADDYFLPYLDIIIQEAEDRRNFVKKAVNWALRSIGKRNPALNARAVAAAETIAAKSAPSARWIASNALRELTSAAVQSRLKNTRSG